MKLEYKIVYLFIIFTLLHCYSEVEDLYNCGQTVYFDDGSVKEKISCDSNAGTVMISTYFPRGGIHSFNIMDLSHNISEFYQWNERHSSVDFSLVHLGDTVFHFEGNEQSFQCIGNVFTEIGFDKEQISRNRFIGYLHLFVTQPIYIDSSFISIISCPSNDSCRLLRDKHKVFKSNVVTIDTFEKSFSYFIVAESYFKGSTPYRSIQELKF